MRHQIFGVNACAESSAQRFDFALSQQGLPAASSEKVVDCFDESASRIVSGCSWHTFRRARRFEPWAEFALAMTALAVLTHPGLVGLNPNLLCGFQARKSVAVPVQAIKCRLGFVHPVVEVCVNAYQLVGEGRCEALE
ncbi:MAG: hypothetical protein AAFY60_19660 [Myxococcota bacterium]